MQAVLMLHSGCVCNYADVCIRLQITEMKLLVELYGQMITEMVSIGKKSLTGSHPSLPSENKNCQNLLEKASAENSDITETYVVGGSAFGWNFVMFTGKDPFYYGATKESFHASTVTPPESH